MVIWLCAEMLLESYMLKSLGHYSRLRSCKLFSRHGFSRGATRQVLCACQKINGGGPCTYACNIDIYMYYACIQISDVKNAFTTKVGSYAK